MTMRTQQNLSGFMFIINIQISVHYKNAKSDNKYIELLKMFGMGMDMGMGMGMGMGMSEQIIINDGYGMGGTTIIENNGFFGRQEQIIIDNGMGMGMGGMGMGMGMGMGGMGGVTVIQNGGFFGPRQQIIINNGGYGYGGYGGYGTNAVVVCPPGCMKACCRRQVCAPGCQLACCVPTYQQPIMYQQPVYQQPVQSVQPVRYQQPAQYEFQAKTSQNKQNVYKGQVIEQNVVVGTPISQEQTKVNKNVNPYPELQQYREMKRQQETEAIICYHLFELRYGKWQGPRDYMLTRVNFDKYPLSFITKIKARTNYEPFSDMLEYGEIILKVVSGNQQMYFAAKPTIIRDYFSKITVIKSRSNQFQEFEYIDHIEGLILKKSNFLGNWEERFVKITKIDGLKSYKNPNEAHSLHIKSIKQVWTWFEVVNGKYMVIKLKHNGMKLQFGIPLNKCGPWIEAFFSLLQTYE